MSTSDQQERGPLTRKQLREIRLTGSTPVITADPPAAEQAPPAPVPPLPRAAKPVEVPPAPAPDRDVDLAASPLTRRQARAQERIRTASVPVVGAEAAAEESAVEETSTEAPAVNRASTDAPVVEANEEPVVDEIVAPVEHMPAQPQSAAEGIVSGIPEFWAGFPVVDPAADEADADDEADAAVEAATDAEPPVLQPEAQVDGTVAALGLDAGDDVLAEVDDTVDDDIAADEHPTVNPAFGQGVIGGAAHRPFSPSFDELLAVGDSTGSSHLAPSALIFTPAPGEGSLSGPIAATGEVLVTGSYELPKGLGSQGHAHGAADGREADAVLIDGELPPTSSPTPIAASAAISTLKPAGEVIRPPAPEKGNKLMLILAITAGGLALALGVALIFAFTTNVF